MAESFGKFLKDSRLNHPGNLSIREVSRRAGIDVSYLSRMEKNEVAPPREEVILKLADVLEIEDPDDLLRLAEKIPPDVQEIIKRNFDEMPSFIRMAKNLSQEDWDRLTNYMKRNILPKKDRQ